MRIRVFFVNGNVEEYDFKQFYMESSRNIIISQMDSKMDVEIPSKDWDSFVVNPII